MVILKFLICGNRWISKSALRGLNELSGRIMWILEFVTCGNRWISKIALRELNELSGGIVLIMEYFAKQKSLDFEERIARIERVLQLDQVGLGKKKFGDHRGDQ